MADYFSGLQNYFRLWLQPWNEKTLTPWEESYDQPRHHIKEQRHYFVNKGPSSQGDGFLVVEYACESWTIKKAEHQRIDAFELWCWRRLLRVPWTARRSKLSILKEISPGCSLGRNDVEAETPILWPPDVNSWLIWKDPDAGKDWRQEEKGVTEDKMVSKLDSITNSMDMNLGKLQETVRNREA